MVYKEVLIEVRLRVLEAKELNVRGKRFQEFEKTVRGRRGMGNRPLARARSPPTVSGLGPRTLWYGSLADTETVDALSVKLEVDSSTGEHLHALKHREAFFDGEELA